MNYEAREQQIAKEAAGKLGSIAELGRFMGVSRQQAHQWTTGQTRLTGTQVLKLQDLLRKVAVIALTVAVSALTTYPTESHASSRSPTTACVLCQILRRVLRHLTAFLAPQAKLTAA